MLLINGYQVLNVMNNVTYGLALIDYYYPETTHIDVKGPDGLHFRFNFIESVI